MGCSETLLLRFHGMPQVSRLTPTPAQGLGPKVGQGAGGARVRARAQQS